MAAARNVSPAASSTLRPSAAKRDASLPIGVVLPEPLTPITSSTKGFMPAMASGFATGVRIFSTSSAMMTFRSSGDTTCLNQPWLIASRTRADASMPRSARISASSISSSMARSSGCLVTRSEIAVPIADEVRLSPPASRSTICLFFVHRAPHLRPSPRA